jgi:DNA-binding LacI/PurR family transcriptional regulator
MSRLGLKPFCVLEGDHEPESGARITSELLRSRPRPTAILCSNDRMAIGAVGVAGALGFAVPDDISIVGADDIWMARYCHPPITTVRIPRDLLGQLALDAIDEMLSSKRKTGSRHTLPTHLVIRQSTGKPTTL